MQLQSDIQSSQDPALAQGTEESHLSQEHVSHASVAMSALEAAPESLRKLALWSIENKPLEGWRSRGGSVIHLHPHVKINLEIVEARDIAFGICREEQLGEFGVSGSELDSRAFADDLLAAIGPNLSRHNLRDLIDVFTEELKESEAERDRNRLILQAQGFQAPNTLASAGDSA